MTIKAVCKGLTQSEGLKFEWLIKLLQLQKCIGKQIMRTVTNQFDQEVTLKLICLKTPP